MYWLVWAEKVIQSIAWNLHRQDDRKAVASQSMSCADARKKLDELQCLLEAVV